MSAIKLEEAANTRVDSLLEELSTSTRGLPEDKLEHLEEHHHKNIIKTKNHNTVFHRLREAFINPFTAVLAVIAVVDYVTDVWSGEDDIITIVIIVAMIFVSAIVSFVQAQRSNDAAAKLQSMISNKVDLIRRKDGESKNVVVDITDVYPGDIVKLSAGDMIPGDIRFLETKNAFIAQAVLTGESSPVEKFADVEGNANTKTTALTDLPNIGFMGSNMVSGTALGVVLATGNDTYLGEMASSITSEKTTNNFDRGVKSVSKLLIRFMIVMVPIVFIINALDKGDLKDALLFAISVAVGLTPEMLPVIMTSALARGALKLSRQKVIVKSLSAIQGFGEMDVLCTDKTGTLTEDKVILERYLNVQGVDDDRILRHAYLNSSFQTGLKNLLDQAVIHRAEENELKPTLEKYKLVDEIPFDFERRRMSVVLEDAAGKRQLISKGAVEEILECCKFVELDGEIIELTDKARDVALKTYRAQNDEGLRVVAVAQKNNVPGASTFSVEDESEMVLIGFVGFLDPPKASAATAISNLKELGVRTVVLTGDSEGVAKIVCQKVGIEADEVLSGSDVDALTDDGLVLAAHRCSVFAKLSPANKERIVKALQNDGKTVGYMGDGINDAPALKVADVSISVDTAVDIAKETANIILLEKDLDVLTAGVESGRATFGNIMKYIKMQVSGNFGNMFSVICASIFLPFLPMLPVQILAQNLLSDFSNLAISLDSVDSEYLKRPRKWEVTSIKRFMITMGPLSSVFDILCFMAMWYILGYNSDLTQGQFQCGWFCFGTISQVLIMYTLRTSKIPFLQAWPAKPLMISSSLVVLSVLTISFTDLAIGLDGIPLGIGFLPVLILLLFGYFFLSLVVKKAFIKRTGGWI